MPRFERYPDESPEAAKRRISKNIAQDKRNPGAPRAVPRAPKSPRAPRTKENMMRRGYNFTRNLGGEDLPDTGY